MPGTFVSVFGGESWIKAGGALRSGRISFDLVAFHGFGS